MQRWRRIVIKIGTSSLTDQSGRISSPLMWAIARGCGVLYERFGAQVVLVSSGAGAVGRERLGLHLPLTLPEKQAAAAVGQSLLVLEWEKAFAPKAVGQMLLTPADIQQRERYVNAKNALEAILKLNIIPIINENDTIATSEIQFGDNDTLSAWAAYLVDADALIILTDVKGLFEADPREVPGAKPIPMVDHLDAVMHLAGDKGSERGTGGMVTKLRAAKIATEAGIETMILGGGGAALEALAEGNYWGTRFMAKKRASARKSWLAQQPSKGQLIIDAGAVKALQDGKSLLSIGIRGMQGQFAFGDALDVTHNDMVIARGLSNYSSESLNKIKGIKSDQIAAVLGYKDYDEVIHRDNLVLLSKQPL